MRGTDEVRIHRLWQHGAVLLNGLLEYGAIAEDEIIVTNRTSGKLDQLKEAHPDVDVVESCAEVASAEIIFLCVRTGDVRRVLEEYVAMARH